MENVRDNRYIGNKNAYKGEYSIDYMQVVMLRGTLSWEKISQEMGIPKTTLIRKIKQWIDHGKSLGYTIEL